jgi:hypothetical protein
VSAPSAPGDAGGAKEECDRRDERAAGVTRLAIATTIGLAALALAACSTAAPEPPAACPTALVLQGAERTASYSAGERRPDALRHLAVVTNLASGCRFGEAGVDVDLAFDLIAERGPAFSGDAVDLSYFVATIGPGRQILSKQLFSSEIPFVDNEDLAGVSEQLTLRLPTVTPEQGRDYGIFLGFQLDDAELQERMQPLLR